MLRTASTDVSLLICRVDDGVLPPIEELVSNFDLCIIMNLLNYYGICLSFPHTCIYTFSLTWEVCFLLQYQLLIVNPTV